jgi:hypothetical protein
MAVVARGDADGLIDATATFVDPAHAMSERANGAAAQAAVLPSFVDTSKAGDKASCLDLGESTVSAPVVVNAAPAPKQATASEPATTSRPTPPRAAPIAYAAAVRAVRPAPHVASPPPAPVSGSTTGGWLANITPAGAGAPIARPSRATTKGSELEGAAAADALAKAQLEASLR